MVDFTMAKQLAGKSLLEAHDYLIQQGVRASDVGLYLGEYLNEVTGVTKRTFNYTTSFPATNANCMSSFTRKFTHENWVDGEDVVLAGTSDENGFNTHFNNITTDLDAI